MNVAEYFVLFFSVIFGGGMAFYLTSVTKQQLGVVISLSGAYLLGITVLHLMPAVFKSQIETIGLWILAGFLLQLLLEQLSQGIEHGHIHANKGANSGFAITIMLGLCLHALIEGLPLGNYTMYNQHTHPGHEHNHLLYGMIMHKAPAAFVLLSFFLKSGFKPLIGIICLVIFASMSPLGALISQLLAPSILWLDRIMGLVVGSFLHIATTILFEADDTKQHRISWLKMGAILVGMGLSLLTLH